MIKDLTKLTAERLCRQWQDEIAFSDPEQSVFILDEWDEIERRVRHEEELEQALAEAQQARDNCNECAKALAVARDEMKAQRDTLRGLLRDLQRIPTMPFPDREAHSERAFADAVWRAWSEIQRRITAALPKERDA